MYLTKIIYDNGNSHFVAHATYTNSNGTYNVKLAKIAREHGLMPSITCGEDNGCCLDLTTDDEVEALKMAQEFQDQVTKVMDSLEKFQRMSNTIEEYLKS